jgi:enoyl-CoA hydratase/carnithine racemase
VIPFLTIRDSRAPVISAVNGICQAGGLLVAAMSDICVASDRATFRVPELLRGIPDATYAALLPAHCGIAVARDLLLSARRFDAAEAQRIGLISRVVPHESLRDEALKAAKEVLQTPPMARAMVKRMLNERYGTGRLPDHVLGPGGIPGAPRGHARLHGEARPGLGPAGHRGRAPVEGGGRAVGRVNTRHLVI